MITKRFINHLFRARCPIMVGLNLAGESAKKGNSRLYRLTINLSSCDYFPFEYYVQPYVPLPGNNIILGFLFQSKIFDNASCCGSRAFSSRRLGESRMLTVDAPLRRPHDRKTLTVVDVLVHVCIRNGRRSWNQCCVISRDSPDRRPSAKYTR